jgi:hypothetical protein
VRTISTVFNIKWIQDPLSPFDLVVDVNGSVQYGISCIVNRLIRISGGNNALRSSVAITQRAPRFFKQEEGLGSMQRPEELGAMVVEHIKASSIERIKGIDIDKSFYLALLYDHQGQYQLHQIPYELPNPANLKWFTRKPSSSLRGEGDDGTLIIYTRNFSNSRITYYPSYKAIIWSSPIFHLEPLAPLENLRYSLQATAEIQKLSAIEKLKGFIEADAEEKEFQRHLKENPWMFGSEYAQLLDRRIWVRDQQKDFMLKRTADGFLEMIEIKRPLNNTPLFSPDGSHHNSLYPGVELSKAIGQVINYLEALDADRHRIRSIDEEDTNKIRAKLIIGRDRDKKQIEALRNLNSHIYRIEILTYDQLLRIANRVVEFE